MGLGQEKFDQVAAGCSGGESLHGGKHFGAVFSEEAAKTPTSLFLLWNSVWQWHLGNLLFIPSYLTNWVLVAFMDVRSSHGGLEHCYCLWRSIQLHQVAAISPEAPTVCQWYSKFQVTFSNINWHWECSRRTKTSLRLKMQHIWPWHKQSFGRCCDIFNLQFQSSKNYVLRCWKP